MEEVRNNIIFLINEESNNEEFEKNIVEIMERLL